MLENIRKNIEENIKTKESLLNDGYLALIAKVSDEIVDSLKKGGKLIVFGNGGSAADAQHFACELVGRFKKERRGLPAICFTTNTSTLTAIANDYSYDTVFKRQLEAFLAPNDIVLGISTSGSAKNVIEAIRFAKKQGVKTIALSGKSGGELAKEASLSIVVPASDTPRIQEAHVLIIHIICEIIDEKFG